MQRAYVRQNKPATFYFYLTGPQGDYGTAGPATGQESSLTAYYIIDGGSSSYTGTTVDEVDGSTMAGVYSVTCTDVVTNGYNIVMNLYHSMGTTYRSLPLAISTDTLYPPGMNIIEVHEDSTAASNLEAAFDGAGYAGGTIKQEVDVAALSGDLSAAANLEAAFNGTGYAGGTVKQEIDINKIDGSTDGVSSLGVGANSMLEGAVTSGSTTSSIKGTGSLSTVDDFYNDRMLLFTGGSGGLRYQGRAITDYDGSSKTFTTDAFTSAPASGDTFLIV